MVGKEALKTVYNIITDILNKKKNRFSEARGNILENIRKMTGPGLELKREAQVEKCYISR